MGTITKHLIENQIPYHIRESSPLFTKFLEYYYEFLDESNVTKAIQDVLTTHDSDVADLNFIKNFFEELRLLPKNLATDERFVARHIHELYQTKGSEQGLKLLFKIVYGDNITVRYPGHYVLRVSDGRWTQSKFVTLNLDSPAPDSFIDSDFVRLTFENNTGAYDIQVTKLEWLSTSKVRVFFKNLTKVVITPSTVMSLIDENQTTLLGAPVQSLKTFSIIDAGSGWKVGQAIVIDGTAKDTILRVTGITATTGIASFDVIEYGWEHNTNSTVVLTGVANAVLGYVTDYSTTTRGYYENDIGQISNSEVKLQDNGFYQQYAYVINTDTDISSFKDIIRLVHPAGTRYFSQLVKIADFDIRSSISGYSTQSVGTIYAQDVVDTSDVMFKSVTRPVSDTQSSLDVVTSKQISKVSTETLVLTETQDKHVSKLATPETATVTDTVGKAITLPKADIVSTPVDTITSRNTTLAKADDVPVTEADVISVTKVLSESSTATETTTKAADIVLGDSTTGVFDTKAAALSITIADTPVATDATSIKPNINLADATSGATDNALVSVNYVTTLSDNTATTDVVADIAFTRNVSDTAATDDTINISGNINKTVNEFVSATDIVTPVTTFFLTFNDTASVIEGISVTQVKYSTDTVTSTDGTPVSTTIVYQSENYFSELYVSPETIINIT